MFIRAALGVVGFIWVSFGKPKGLFCHAICVVGFIRVRWGDLGVVGNIPARHLGRWVHSGALLESLS